MNMKLSLTVIIVLAFCLTGISGALAASVTSVSTGTSGKILATPVKSITGVPTIAPGATTTIAGNTSKPGGVIIVVNGSVSPVAAGKNKQVIPKNLSATSVKPPDKSLFPSSQPAPGQTIQPSVAAPAIDQKKLSTDLLQLIDPGFIPVGQSKDNVEKSMEKLHQFIPAEATSSITGGQNKGDLVYVYITFRAGSSTKTVDPFVAKVMRRDETGRIIVAWVPVSNLARISTFNEVTGVRTVQPPMVHAGSVTTEGDIIHHTAALRLDTGLNGTGIKIGVISDGVDDISIAQVTGDLPPNVHILRNDYGGNEGVAMLEIIHDLAPGAELYFHDCGFDALDFNAAVDALVGAGCNVIVDDINWVDQPYFEDGTIATHIRDQLNANNIVYISAAGNYGYDSDNNGHYQGNYYSDAPTTWHDFSRGTNVDKRWIYVTILPGGGIQADLQWNDPWGASGNDYDLYLLDVARLGDADPYLTWSVNYQQGTTNPYESFYYKNLGSSTLSAAILVDNYEGNAATRTLELFIKSDPFTFVDEYNLNATDAIFGQAALPEVVTSGAVNWATPTTIEPSSSRGPVTIAFPTPEQRPKPDICGVDGVEVSGAGGFSSPFYGTSAAAAHIAGISGQPLERFPREECNRDPGRNAKIGSRPRSPGPG